MSDVRVSSWCHEGGCVTVDFKPSYVVLTDPNDWYAQVVYTHDEWRAFVLGVKAGEFDVPG